MFRVDGLGEDGRAAVRMAVRRRTPFEYSPDGRTWTEIDDDEGQAFRVYGLLDPRQVIANVPTLDPARFEESADFFKPGMSEIDGSVRLDRWSPPLPRSFAEFLSAAESDRRIRMVFVEGRVLEIEQPDLAPFSGDQIRVVYHYRPVTPRAVLEWWLGALVGWIRRVRGR